MRKRIIGPYTVVWLLCGIIGTQGHLSDVARLCGFYPVGWRVNLLVLTGPLILASSWLGAAADPERHWMECAPPGQERLKNG